jgi:peptide chain release factor subunit 3
VDESGDAIAFKPEGGKSKLKMSASSMSWSPNAAAAEWSPGGAGGFMAAAAAPAQPSPAAVAPAKAAPVKAAAAPPADAKVEEAPAAVEAAPAAVEEDAAEEEEEESRPPTEAEMAELSAMLAAGEISQADFDEACGGGDGGGDSKSPDAAEAVVAVEEKEEGGSGGAGAAKPVKSAPAAVAVQEGDPREHMNVVFIGHVDAGKSTLSGQILFLTNQVDQRLIDKFSREAKERNRESWFMAYIMDTNEEERAKGKTVEVGMAHFETETKRYTILDAPGHKNYVPNMIGGAAQADIAVLVISTRRGEFETGFEKGGQTREHAMLAKTLGVNKLVVVMNKMDDPTVDWSQERFDECKSKLTPYVKRTTR